MRTALGIKKGDKIRFEGIVLDNEDKPVNNQQIIVYNSIKYKTDQNNSKENIASLNDGKFFYPSPSTGIILDDIEGGIYPFWFKIASGEKAIPFDLVILDKSTTVDEINKTLDELIPSDGIIKCSSIELNNQEFSELFIPAEAYPFDDENLQNISNNNFWKFFTVTYVGPIDENFLITSDYQRGWLKLGLDLYNNSINNVLSSLPERFSSKIPFKNNSLKKLKKEMDYDPFNTFNFIEYGAEGLVCASTLIPTGVTQVVGPIGCGFLATHIAEDVVTYAVTNDFLQKPWGADGNEELDASLELGVDLGFLLFSVKDISKHIVHFQNPRNLVHGGKLGRLKADVEISHDIYEIGKTGYNTWDYGELMGKYYSNKAGEFKGCEFNNLIYNPNSESKKYLNLNITRALVPSLKIHEVQFNNTINPDYLAIEIESSRPIFRKGTTQKTSPLLYIGNSSFNMDNISIPNSKKFLYQTKVPISQLPNFNSSNPSEWFENISASGSSFETMSGGCSGAFCGALPQTITLSEGDSSGSLPKISSTNFIAKLFVPKNAFGSQSSFVSLSLESPNLTLTNEEDSLKNTSSVIEVNTNDINFSIPSTLQIPLRGIKCDDYKDLAIYRYNDFESKWEEVVSINNYYDSVSTANISLPGKYSLMYSSITSYQERDRNKIISQFVLFQNYPNPFNSSTKIKYQLTEQCRVHLKVFDILGRDVKTLVDETKDAGIYEIEFDGSSLSSGIYYYKIQADEFVSVKKLILVK